VATIHDVIKETIRNHLTLVHVFHAYASADTSWLAHALSQCTPVRYGRIASSQRHMTLLNLRIPYVSYAPVHNKVLVHSDPTDTGGGYHLGALNFRSDHSSPFPSSIFYFPLIASPGLQLNHSINYSSSQHSNLKTGYKNP
jgi:hypothetical protein